MGHIVEDFEYVTRNLGYDVVSVFTKKGFKMGMI